MSDASPQRGPLLGTSAQYVPATPPSVLDLTPSVCFNLSLFKDLMRQYRALDDSVTMRLNRNAARFRDLDRLSHAAGSPPPTVTTASASSSRDPSLQAAAEACASFWEELVRVWEGREKVVEYCIDQVDKSVEKKKAEMRGEAGLDGDVERRDSLYGDEVLRQQLHNELTIEQIIRQRSLDAFKARCKRFQPELKNEQERAFWEGRRTR